MLGKLDKVNGEVVFELHRDFPWPVSTIWEMLTDNQQLKKWFSELEIAELSENGKIVFNLGDGTVEELTIIEVQVPTVLEFTWDKDLVRFNLSENSDGSAHLVFKEYIKEVTDQTARDIAGWHVCLDAIRAVLEEQEFDRKHRWKKVYETYKKEMEKFIA